MKSKHLLLLMLLALFAPWAAKAQTTELTVNDGTATTTNEKIPVNGLYVDTQGTTSEFIIPAETAGMSDMEGGSISKVTFYISQIPETWGSPTIQLYLGEVEGTTLSSLYGPSNFTVVKTMVWSNQQSTIEVEFDEPYTYEGGNLLVGTYVQTKSTTYKSTKFSGVSGESGCSRYNNGSGTGTSQNFLPKTTFVYEPAQQGGDVCEKPATLVAENVTSNSATLTWTGGSGTYNVEVKGGSYADWTSVLSNTNLLTTPLSNLTAVTDYQARVQSVCDGDTPTSGWKTVSFTTPCGAIAPGYTCGFEGPNTGGTTSYPLPACWTRPSGTSTQYPYSYSPYYSSYVHGGSYALYFYGNTTTTAQIAVLPEIEGGVNGKRLAFYQFGAYSFSVGYMTDPTDASTFEAVYTQTGTSTYALHEVDFADIADNPRYMAIKSNVTSYSSIYFDDLELKETPTCLRPTMNTTATNIAATTATVSWTAGGENQDHWDLYYSNTNTAPTATSVPQVTFTANNPHTLTGLQPSTSYYVWVRGNCGTQDEPDYSEWSANRCYFTTTAYCANMQVQSSTINFTNITYNSVTVNWTGAGDATQWKVQLSTTSNFAEIAKEETASETSKTINGLLSNQTYYVRIAPYCEEAEDYTPWSSSKSFTTPESCPAPVLAAATNPTAHGATFTWTGTSESYTLMSGEVSIETLISADFEDNTIPSDFTNSTTYAWTVTNANKHAGTYSIKSGGAGTAYATSDLTLTLNLNNPATISFWYLASSEGTYDYGRFLVDGTQKFQTSGTSNSWSQYTAELAAGEHTLIWRYYKDSGTDSGDDCFYVDDITITVSSVGEWQTVETDITENSVVVNNDNIFAPETTYQVKVVGICPATEEQSSSNIISFTTANSCETPSGLVESEVTATTAKITWNTYGLTDFNLRYGTDGENWTVKNNVSCPYTIEELTANTAYQVQVQAGCNLEEWSTVLNFRTECAPKTITETDYINEGFEYYTGTSYSTNGVVPYCWDNDADGNILPHVIGSGSYYYVHNGSKALTFYGSGNCYAYLPEFTNNLNTLQISFWARVESTSYGTLTLGYFDSENEFKVIDTYTSKSTMTEYTTYLGLKENVPDNARLVFRWYCDNQYSCCIDDVVVKLAPSCFPVGTLAEATDIQATSAKLSWALVDDTQTAWQVCLNGDEDHLVAANTHVNFLLENLSPETAYTVKVRANCGDSQGEWSNEISFTTLEACPAPSGLAASNLTQNTADLTWTGESDSYNVQYRTAAGATTNQLLFEGFETYADEAALEAVWTVLDLGDGANTDELGLSSSAKKTGDYGFRFSSFSGSSSGDFDQYLISPVLTQAGLLEFAYKSSSGSEDKFRVGYSSTTNDVSAFTWGDEMASASSWKTFSETMPENAKYFAINYTAVYKYRLYIDDITIYELNPAGEWQPATSTTTSTQLTNLTAGTEYEVQVQGVCDNVPGNWCDAITFTTMAEGNKVFTNATADGKWGTAGNWVPTGAPALTDEVIIRANATIDGDAAAKKITFEGSPTPTLTIADGGKLMTDNNVTATVKKNVASYGESTNGGYVLLTSPIGQDGFTSYSPVTAGLITANEGDDYTYDLYEWSANPSDDNEWRNYRKNDFSLYHGEGYLYANKNDVELTFTGIVQANNVDVEKTGLDYGTEHFQAWNLYGNPFMCDAYLNDATSADMAFYRMNTNGDGFTAATGAVRPMEGVFVQTSAASQSFKFSRTQIETSRALLNVNLTKVTMRGVEGSSDNAIIRFDQGGTLEKFSFRKDASKVYIPQDNIDYAVVSAEAMGELPVNFRANENGSYTLSFTSEEVSFSYLHLVDNMTGNDVDLLQTPSYTFDALTTDYESRFKLVFATGNAADDSFAFYSNGNWIINNDGQATLQVIDVTGRILSSETVNGSVSTTINAAPGVYMLRLVNGDNVKVQKVVVR